MPGQLLQDEPADGVLRLTISNPAKRNALDHAILDGIAETLAGTDALCGILTGAQGMFSSGYDIGDIPDDVFAVEAEKLVAHPFTSAIDALDAVEVPPFAAATDPRAGVGAPRVAALGGPRMGGGRELALACAFRAAAGHIRLGMP